MRTQELRIDLGIPSGDQWDSVDDSLAKPGDNYVLLVGRREPLSRGAAQLNQYAAGLLLESSVESAGLARSTPIRGVLPEDMQLLERQLGEIAALADEQDLTMIDRVTLLEGKGVMIVSEP